MKRKVHNQNIIKALVFSIIMMFSSYMAYANSILNQVIISGQVTNYEYGNPVKNHPVFIESELTPEGRGYASTLYTDAKGYYYDTITTTKSKGSFFVYTLDHYGLTMDTTVHFRFLERGSSIVIADFKIYLPFQAEQLQAKFKFVQKMNGENNVFNFFDLTNNENAISWQWNFGDGRSSHVKNPIHEYNSYGLFRVSLIVTAIIDGIPIESEITKQIYITQLDYYHLGGHVFSDYFPIDKGYAYLYIIDSADHCTPLDTVSFDTLGYYYFYQVPEGNYIVKAEPMKESEYYGTLLPTYYGNCMYWEDAQLINLKNTSWEYNIKLDKSQGLLGGTGGIGGNVNYINSGRIFNDYSAKGVNIYLLDENDNILTCRYSDNIGDFWFDFIDIDTYWLYPEITGISADHIKVELTNEVPVVNDIRINILTSSISYVLPNESDSYNTVGQPYPNPVSGTFSIPLSSVYGKDISYEIYDSFGNMVSSQKLSSTFEDGYNVSVSNLKSGMYTIRTIIDNNFFNRTFIVVR